MKCNAWRPMSGCAMTRCCATSKKTRTRGFGQRTEGYWEYPVRLPFLIRAIALPVRAEGRLAGSIALHWPLDQAPVERVMSCT